MASHLNFRGVQQSLSARRIRCQRVTPYSDGRNRYAVWPEGKPRITAQHTDNIDMAYILGLKMASSNEGRLVAHTR